MGYQIRYGETTTKQFLPESKKETKFKINLVWISIACCVLLFTFLKNKDAIINYLLPGNKEITRTAISAFAEDLRQGQSIGDAAVNFCREIIENANIQD